MDTDNAMQRLLDLQRDLIAFTESRLPALERLSDELDASIGDLRKLLEKKEKNEDSRKKVDPATTPKPDTLKIEDEEYRVTEDFRQVALQVADEIDLDELQAAKLCLDAELPAEEQPDTNLPYRALIRFHEERYILLDCVRLVLHQTLDLETGDELGADFQDYARRVVRGEGGGTDGSAYWRKCMDGLAEVEAYIKKLADHQQTMSMTGSLMEENMADAFKAQRTLLTRQHERLAAIMSYLFRGGHVTPQDFRSLISKAAALEDTGDFQDVTLHYLPVFISGSAYFGSDNGTTVDQAKELHHLFIAGHGKLQWKQPSFKAAATISWLAEYSARFSDPTSTQTLRVADRQKEEEERTKLFFDCVKDRALHFVLAACTFLKPEVWHDPAKVELVQFLLDRTEPVTALNPASCDFVVLTMAELQAFSDALVANMPDVIRRLKVEEDDQRRAALSGPLDGTQRLEMHLERFLVIMSYAYQDDAEAAQDFWSNREDNLHGFLRWASQRLPTPRVAAFCELLRAIAIDEKSGNQAHRFLLGDSIMTSGKLRKAYSVSWSQIFSELEIYSTSVKNQPATSQQVPSQNGSLPESDYMEPETNIMLAVYLRLASHICRVSPDARNWVLREQTFHLGELLFDLAQIGDKRDVQALCFDLLAALLTDKVSEVNDGMWALLEGRMSGGAPVASNLPRLSRHAQPIQYLQNYAINFETATGLVGLLNALVTPSHVQEEMTHDALPFPENLGAQNRHGGIDAYVDFVLGSALRLSTRAGQHEVQRDVLRCACLDFVCICLSNFNEDLVAIANTANIVVDSAMRTSSLAAYARLHPFARVMDWMFNSNVIACLVHTAEQSVDELNELDEGSPKVQATLRSIQAMNLTMKLQATYFDIVRPLMTTQSSGRTPSVANSTLASYDAVMLSQLDVVAQIATFAASNYAELCLESLSLLQKLLASRKLGDAPHDGGGPRMRLGNRLVSKLAENSDAIATGIRPYLEIFPWDVESGEKPLKLVKAKAILDVLNSSLDTAAGRPAVAHCLLGLRCHMRAIAIEMGNMFEHGLSLFHTIAGSAAEFPCALGESNTSWLLAVKRACWEVVLKLALSPLTASIVLPELRSMDLLSAACANHQLALANPLWDEKSLVDPSLLLDSSALAVRDFLHVREAFFEYAALELRTTNESRATSVQENVVSALLGTIKFENGDQQPTYSVFDLFDFFDIETAPPCEASCRYLKDVDMSICVKDDAETVTAFDVTMAEELLILRKRELINNGTIKDAQEELQGDDELRAILASLTSQNNWQTIQAARLSTLEAWTDLLSLMVTSSGLKSEDLITVALQGLQVVLPRFERALSENMDAAALLAKLTLTLVPAVVSSSTSESQGNANLAQERLTAVFRACLKAITDSATGLALRDVCYRTCCAVLTALPLTVVNGKPAPSPNARQLLQLMQATGDRLVTVITEDAFSGRGVTRVSALLFLDALVALFQLSKATLSISKALTKLNFVPVLIDQSIGSVTQSFQGDNEELVTAVAYFHTALSLMLRVCQTADGTQLILNSGFFAVVADSRLFSTDPDIGLDIDNPVALREFYKILSAVLRVITAVVIARGPNNAAVLQQAKSFLQQNRFSMQAVFKRTSAVQKTAGPPEEEAVDVADEFSKLLFVTGFLDVSAT